METEDRVQNILDQAKTRGPGMWDNEKLSSFVKGIDPPLSKNERIELATRLVKKDTFLWLDYISEEVRELATTDASYVDLLFQLVSKVRKDLAGGQIVRALVNVGEKDPRLGIDLSEAMRERNDESLTIYSSFPLGGAGRVEFEQAKPQIDGLWNSDSSLHQVTALRAYRIIGEPSQERNQKVVESIFQLFENAASKEDIEVQKEAAQGLFDLAKVDEQRSMKSLLMLLERPGAIRGIIAQRLQLKNDFSKESQVSILRLIAQEDDDGILSQVAMVLMLHGKNYPREAMEIVILIAERGKYRSVYELDYAAEQVAKVNLPKSIEMVRDAFLKTTSEHFKFIAPHLLEDIAKSDYNLLADFVKSWLRDSRLEKMAIKTGRELLQKVFESQTQAPADTLFPIIEAMAKERDIDVLTITKRENDKVAQCIELLDAIERASPRLDYAVIKTNWQKFPALRQFLKDRWIRQRESEGNRSHEILYNLAYLLRESQLERLLKEPTKDLSPFQLWARSMRVRGLLWPRVMLTYLDAMAHVVKNMSNISELKSKLVQDDQYSEAFSELEIISHFSAAGYPVRIAPQLGGKKLDLEVLIDESHILFEVKNPTLFRKLKYAGGGTIPNRARSIVHAEFTHHLVELPKTETRPIIVVLDIARSEIDYDFVVDYLHGSLQFTFLRDKKTNRVVDKGWTRADDSIHREGEKAAENLDLISAVICYKTELGSDGRFHLKGTIFVNPTGRNRLTDTQLDKISKALFEVNPRETIRNEH